MGFRNLLRQATDQAMISRATESYMKHVEDFYGSRALQDYLAAQAPKPAPDAGQSDPQQHVAVAPAQTGLTPNGGGSSTDPGGGTLSVVFFAVQAHFVGWGQANRFLQSAPLPAREALERSLLSYTAKRFGISQEEIEQGLARRLMGR